MKKLEIYLQTTNQYHFNLINTKYLVMNINDKMALDAAGIKERIARGEQVSKEDRKFLTSYLNINTRKASNGGKRKIIKTGK